MKNWIGFAGGLAIAAVAGVALGYSVAHQERSAASFEAADTPPPSASKIFPGMQLNYNGEGTFKVPSQVPIATYEITSISGMYGCKWETLTSLDDKPKHQIAANTINKGGFDTVTLTAEVKYFRLEGQCLVTRSGARQ